MKINLRHRLMLKRRTVLGLVALLIIIAIISFTIGQDIIAGRQPDLYSFSIINFAGYLFFLVMPVEALVPYYLAEGHSGIILIVIAVVTAIIAQLFDYFAGHLMSGRIINDLIGHKKYERAWHYIHKYGGWAILVFNLFPLSSPILILAAGMVRFSLKRVICYSLIGLVLKYVAIVYLFGLF
ncbi:VTT domain-containing protein [Candidatus Woesearchaeota archaeon]|nr:VTT domain-containing protein [Candidatus Woesearchaeota archaeon]